MSDEENQVEPVAPATDETQTEPAASAEEEATSPAVPAEKEELILGKFKSQDDLVKSYQELEQKTTKTAQEKAQLEQYLQSISSQAPQQGYAPDQPQLDADSDVAVRSAAREEFERMKAAEFESRHPELKEDKVLAATTKDLIAEARKNRQYLDQEVALTQAKKMLDERIKPQIKQAQAQGVEQGADLAQKKGQLGAIGESGPRPETNLDDLSAEDYAKALKIPRDR